MSLTSQHRKQLRALGHQLKPVVIVAGNGLSESVQAEIGRALLDHELIKIKLAVEDRVERAALIDAVCQHHGAEAVQSIGKVALLYKESLQPKPTSNLPR